MTKKELKEYIKEMILKEVSQEDVESAKELNKELEKTKELSDKLGLTKENINSNDNREVISKLITQWKELKKLRREAFQKSDDDTILRLDRQIHQVEQEIRKEAKKTSKVTNSFKEGQEDKKKTLKRN
jgi:hypothetical protein